MAMNLVKLPTGKSNLQLRVSKGHYATSHSHINYYIDVTLTKFRLSEARAAAAELVREYKSTTIVDTILCLDGTEVIGACMASELTKAGYTNMNAPPDDLRRHAGAYHRQPAAFPRKHRPDDRR